MMQSPSQHRRASDDRRYRWGSFVIIALAACTYLAGAGRVALWDRDEAWYAQTSRQMAQGGDWLVPYFLDQPRYAKPILIYWCQALSMKVLGPTELAARLPSAIAMAITLCTLAVVLMRFVGAKRGMYTVLIFASSAMVIMSAKMCLTDSLLLVFVTAMELLLGTIYLWHGRLARGCPNTGEAPVPLKLTIPLWLCIALAGLTKGPIVLLLLFSTLLTLSLLDAGWNWKRWRESIRWWKSLRFGLGILVIAAVVLPWLGMLAIRRPDVLRNMLLEPVRHISSNQDGMWVYPGYYIVSIWLTFFPWSLFLPLSLILAWKHRRTPQIRFALAIVIGNWVYAELMVTKLPHYMLPSFGALAFLTATALIRCMRRQSLALYRWKMKLGAGVWALFVLAFAALPWLPLIWFQEVPRFGAVAFSAVAMAYASGVLVLLLKRKVERAAWGMGTGLLAAVVVLYTLYFPRAQFLRMPMLVGSSIAGQKSVQMLDYAEPSVAFYQGGSIPADNMQEGLEESEAWLAHTAPADWPRWIVTTGRVYDAMNENQRQRLRKVETVRGFNYNHPFGLTDVVVLERTDDKSALVSREK